MSITQQDIELEAALLKSLANKNNYTQFIKVLDTKKLIPITNSLLSDYKKYYDKYDNDIDWEVFHTEFTQNWHKKDLDGQDMEYYNQTVFPLIRNAVVKDNLMTSLLERQATVSILESVDMGFSEEEIEDILKDFKEKRSSFSPKEDEDVFKLGRLDLSVLDSSSGLTWALPALQAGLGSLMSGQFIVVAADSGAGKSAFCITQAVHIFKQLHERKETRPILYLTSEDTKEDLETRFYSNLYKDKILGGFEEVISQRDKVQSHYIKTYDDSLFLAMQIRGPQDVYKLRTKIDKYNPCLVFIDMLDKLSGSDDIKELTKLYQEIRSLSNDGRPIIGTSQSGNTSYLGQDQEGKPKMVHRKQLSDKDLSGSKSGKQGAAYGMIMIGMDDDMPGIRYLSTTKKKRGKNVRVTCKLTDVYSLYEELI